MRGFTLMEVLVAFAVLGLGSAAVLHAVDGFGNLKKQERLHVQAHLLAASTMESLVLRASCSQSAQEQVSPGGRFLIRTRFLAVPGTAPLALATVNVQPVETSSVSPVQLKRLLLCNASPASR